MTPEFPYVQLTGAYKGFFRKASLWEGIDHILSVSGSRFNEEYRRFYFRDIQAIIIEKRPRAGSLGWWTILFILLIVAALVTLGNTQPYSWVAVVLLSLLIVIRLEISFRRSCRCSIQTAVSREPLPSLIRRKDAQRTVSRLHVLVASEQGELPADIPASEDEVEAVIIPPDSDAPPRSQVLQEAAIRFDRESATRGVNFAVVALFILLANSIFTFWVSSGLGGVFSTWTIRVGYWLIVLGAVPIFFALQNLERLPAVKSLRVFLISVLAVNSLRLAVGWTMGVFWVALASRRSNFLLFQRYYSNVNGGLQLLLAAGGLILIFVKWETYRRGNVSSN
jgi:hypothetical protein